MRNFMDHVLYPICLRAAAYPGRGGKGAWWHVFSNIQKGWSTSLCRYRGYVRNKLWDRRGWLLFCALVRRKIHLRLRKVGRTRRRGRGRSSLHWRFYVVIPWVSIRTNTILVARAGFPLSTHHNATSNDSPRNRVYVSLALLINIGACFRGSLRRTR